MKIGSTTSVVVTADDQHLDTDDGTGATTVNRNLINNLPLINRSVMDLAYLAPGNDQRRRSMRHQLHGYELHLERQPQLDRGCAD